MARTWRIGEVAERTGLTRRTLRHYDDLGLLVPAARSGSDYRRYDEADLLRLLQIQSLKALGLGLAEIAAALAEPEVDASATLRSHLVHLTERIAAEQQLADRLRTLAGATERSWDDVLAAIALTQQLAHPDPAVRLRAALQSTADTGELFSALAAEPDPAVQEVLVWALAQQPDGAATALAHLGDPDPNLRCLLARLLGKLRERDAVPALVELLDDPEPRVVTSAVHALGQIGHPTAAGPLVALLEPGPIRVADLVEAIANLGPAAIAPLAVALASASAETRAAAAEALGRLGGGLSTERRVESSVLLEPLLADPDPEVRLAALLALGELGGSARASIELALTDPQLEAVARRLLDLHVTSTSTVLGDPRVVSRGGRDEPVGLPARGTRPVDEAPREGGAAGRSGRDQRDPERRDQLRRRAGNRGAGQ
jgi:DNA-binding transcriptional MerR regulator